MVTSKIILLLKKLNETELQRFRDFVQSPFFNNKTKIVRFFDELVKYAPAFEKIDRVKIYKRLYPNSPFNGQVYKNLSSQLYQLGREFIAFSHYKTDGYSQSIDLLEKLEAYGADELFNIELKDLQEKLTKSKFNDAHFLHKFKLALLERTYLFHRSKRTKLNTSGNEESNELLKYYFFHAFRQRFDFESLGLNFNINEKENPAMSHIRKQLEAGLVQQAIEDMQKAQSKDHEIIAIFYYILMSFKYPDNDLYFTNAKQLVFKNINKFDNPARYEVSDALYGMFSFRMMLNPSIENYRDTFDILNFRLKNNIYRENAGSYFDAISFRAAFLTGVKLKEYDWLKRFLKKYIKEVNPEHRDNLNNLLTGFTRFFDGQFEDSLSYLNKVRYDINLYKLDVRKLQLMNYYELSHVESALSLVSSFKEFLSSNKEITGDERLRNQKMLNIYTRLMKLKENYDEHGVGKLEADVNKTANLLYKDWFTEKVKQLKKENKK